MDDKCDLRDILESKRRKRNAESFDRHWQNNGSSDWADEGVPQNLGCNSGRAFKRHWSCSNDGPEESHLRNKIPKNKIYNREKVSAAKGNTKERLPTFGYKSLKMMLNKPLSEMIIWLTIKKDELYSFLEKNLQPDVIMLMVEILAKLSESPTKENKAAFLSHSLRPNFLEAFSTHSCDLVAKELKYSKAEVVSYFQNLAVFYQDAINILPNTATDVLKEHLIRAILAIQGLISMKEISELVILEQKFKDLRSSVISMIKSQESAHKGKCDWKLPETDFREISVFPLPQDVLSHPRHQLSPVVKIGPYQSVEHYLNVQFHLMREDFLIPLRGGIVNYIHQNSSKKKKLKHIENVRFYKEVRFLRQFQEGDAVVTEVLFDPKKRMKNIKWKRSKRFLYGALICFSSDSFENLFLGIITNRDVALLEKGIVQCELKGEVTERDLFNKEFTMAESEVYFESYQHVLKALKIFNEQNFPLQEYIIKVSCDAAIPNYLVNEPGACYTYGEYKFFVSDLASWPTCNQLKVNESQLKALHSAMTQKLAIIQGPPGTGKTYLGLIIAKMLFENSSHWRNKNQGPILVVCYTNHALDQFLEGILSFTENIVRIGSQSKNENLKNYNLKTVRKDFAVVNHALIGIESELKRCARKIAHTSSIIKGLPNKSVIISLKYLQHGMNNHHRQWFQGNGDKMLVDWLLEGAYFQSYSDNPISFNDIEEKPECMEPIYAYSLMQLQDEIIELQNGKAAPETIHAYEYFDSNLRLKQNIFLYVKNKLLEQVYTNRSWLNELLRNPVPDLIHPDDRWVLYHHWVCRSIEKYEDISFQEREEYQKLNNKKLEILDVVHLEAVSYCDVVGMTTTGAAKQQTLLQKLGPKIVIVEEAAEIMESHVVVSLSEKCEHLILIGDHKQLRPKPAVYKLAKDYNFDVSLFERMLDNHVPCNTLEIQHRMHPEIADLIIPAIYPALKNHKTVMLYENIKGLKKNVYFITHSNVEQLTMDDSSKTNIVEARFLIALCRHLVLQGYDPNEITILATYTGQMFCLMEEREKSNIIKGVRITVVDNYQGEENDIILLSLVRNNTEGKIGFLGFENRVCVALSRAKKGLYIMGNIEMLSAKSPLWHKIKSVLEAKEAIGTHLPLQCVNHPSQLTNVCEAKDFISITEGGCNLICDTVLGCGHVCKKMCHVTGHKNYICKEICGKRMCDNDHRCKKLCWEKCGRCMVILEHTLPCGHRAKLRCHVDPLEHSCQELVNVTLPHCAHINTKECCIDLNDVVCSFKCEYRLRCGHACQMKCHVKDDPEHLNIKCLRWCEKKNKSCNNKHRCQKRSYEDCDLCVFHISRKLPNCSHYHMMKCHINPEKIKCIKPCNRELPCGHKCPLKCGDECGNCQVLVEKEMPDCKHKIKMKCHLTPVRQLCTMVCERTLSCGHICEHDCALPCSEKECNFLTNETIEAPCGHEVRLQCGELRKVPNPEHLLIRCNEPCSTVLECDHRCQGTCGECMQGRIHVPCQEKCGKVLICGHSCTVSCSQTCPPCTKKCYIKCEHSTCNLKCGYPCSPCKERCNWKCVHLNCKKLCGELCDRPPCEEPCQKPLSKCGHGCIGFCGETCPHLCRKCDALELEEIIIFLGSEDDLENARFVMLQDCKHTFDSKGLDKWMAMNENTVKMKECPLCNTPIQNVYRYGNIIKKNFVNVQKVKHKLYSRNGNIIPNQFKDVHSFSWRFDFLESKQYYMKLKKLVVQVNRNQFDIFLINSLASRIEFVQSIINNYSDMKQKVDKLLEHHKNADKLITIILRHLKFLSPQQHHDLTCECMRFHLKLQLAAVEATSGFKTFSKEKWHPTYMECKKLVYSLKKFPKELYEETHKKIDEIYKILTEGHIGLSKVEMNTIVKAIKMRQGSWLLCPNGHVYVIGDCGGAMEKGRCNECGAQIGGTNHQLLFTNRRLDSAPGGL